MSLLLVDYLLGAELLVLLVLHIAQQEDEVAALAWLQGYFDVVRCDRAPSVGKTVAWLAFHHSFRLGKLVVESDEALAVGIVALNLGIHCVESIVVAALTIFGLVIDGRAFYLYFARREVALEVLHVGSSIPEAPFGKGEYLEGLHLLRLVLQRHLLHFCPGVQWHEEEHTCLHAVLAARDAGIVHAVAALVAVERCLARFPPRVPYCIAILDVEIATAVIHRHTVVAVTGDATELGILVEGITTCCV